MLKTSLKLDYLFEVSDGTRKAITNVNTGLTNPIVYGSSTNHGVSIISNNQVRFVVDSTGNCGIGLTTPKAQLHLSSAASTAEGTIVLRTEGCICTYAFDADGHKRAELTNTGGGGKLQLYDGWANLGSNLVKTQFSALWKENNFIYNGGNFGVGTYEPQTTLHVAGDILCEGMIIGNVEAPKGAMKFTAGHAYEIGEDLTGKAGSALIMDAGKVFLSTTPKDKRVIGFLEKIFTGNSSLDSTQHDNLASVIGLGDSRHWKQTIIRDASGNQTSVTYTPTINGANVCNENGNINIGDFLTTSSRKGYFMKQDDDLVHNYTAARCCQNVVFGSDTEKKNIYCIMMCG